jgi:hypothetical protein
MTFEKKNWEKLSEIVAFVKRTPTSDFEKPLENIALRRTLNWFELNLMDLLKF